MNLSSPERVVRAIYRRETDRVPCFFRAEGALVKRLAAELGLNDAAAVAGHFGSDVRTLSVSYDGSRSGVSLSDTSYTDMFGNVYGVTADGRNKTSRIMVPVLAPDGEPQPVDSIVWPDASVIDINRCIKEAKLARESGLAVYGGVWASVFTQARRLLGEETFLVTMYEDPGYISGMIDRLTDFYLEINKTYLDHCYKYIDVFYFGSDFGTQRSMFISPEHFRLFFKPSLSRIARQAKGYGLPVMFHSCGSVAEIIDDFIECGIDALDPVQTCAAGMDVKNLSRFKGRISFNGGVSTQKVLPFLTPEEVADATRSLVDELGPTGLIIGPDQDMIGDIPTANIVALFETVKNARL